VQEGLFLYTHNVSPYDGGVFHQAPLLLPLFSMLPDPTGFPLPTDLMYIALDLTGAYALVQIAETGTAMSTRLFTSPRRDMKYGTIAVAAGFLFNPFTIAACLARTTSVITNTLILLSMSHAARGRSSTFLLTIGLASYLSLYPLFLFPGLCILCYSQRQSSSSPKAFALSQVAGMVVVIGGLINASIALTGSTQFLWSTYGTLLLLPDLTPNVGLWWYFFIEMFDSFRSFFLGVFWLHMASYVPAITIRLRKQPLFACAALMGVVSIFQPYPSVADSALFLGLVPLFRHVFPRTYIDPWTTGVFTNESKVMRYPFLETAVLMYASLLGPAFYHLWIYAGSGNANFFYAITLVWSLGQILVVADLLYAVLRDEWETERPDMKGKEVRQI
jgi:GPI-anchor transamidase subunit U